MKCRSMLHITQEKLAEAVGLSVSYMGAIERGEKLPKLETFIRIANILQVSADALLSDVLAVSHQLTASNLSTQLSALPAPEQRRILHVVETMISDYNT